MPPAAKPLVMGQSVEADVVAKLDASPGKDDAKLELSKDESLGGTMSVSYNEHKSVSVRKSGVGEAYLWAQHDAVPRLGKLTITMPDGCVWLQDNLGKLDGAKKCPGNRKTGIHGDNGYLCMTLDDGRIVHAECSKSYVDYWIGKKR